MVWVGGSGRGNAVLADGRGWRNLEEEKKSMHAWKRKKQKKAIKKTGRASFQGRYRGDRGSEGDQCKAGRKRGLPHTDVFGANLRGEKLGGTLRLGREGDQPRLKYN